MTASEKVNDLSAQVHPFFRDLRRSSSPNSWLIAPEGFPGKPDEWAPVFDVPLERLMDIFGKMTGSIKSVSEASRNADLVCYVDETSILHFKDDICVQFLSVGSRASTIAAYSASRVGYWDLGTNRRRLRGWLKKLAESAKGT